MLPLPVMAVRSIMLAACVGSMDAKEANGAGIVETIPVSSVSAISIMDSNRPRLPKLPISAWLMALNAIAHTSAMIIRKAPCWMSSLKPAHAMALASKAPIDAAAVPGNMPVATSFHVDSLEVSMSAEIGRAITYTASDRPHRASAISRVAASNPEGMLEMMDRVGWAIVEASRSRASLLKVGTCRQGIRAFLQFLCTVGKLCCAIVDSGGSIGQLDDALIELACAIGHGFRAVGHLA